MNPYLAGFRYSLALFSLVLFATFIGIGALAKELGFPIWWSAVAASLIWAGPAQVIFMSGVSAGIAPLALALTIGLSSVRMMPMVVSLMPYFREGKHSTFKLLLAAHIVSISTWAEGQKVLPKLEPDQRLPFFLGMGVSVLTNAFVGTYIGYIIAGVISKPFAAGLLFLTPLFFLLTLLNGAKSRLDYLAISLGLGLLLSLQSSLPNLALLIAGVGGGTLSYFLRKKA